MTAADINAYRELASSAIDAVVKVGVTLLIGYGVLQQKWASMERQTIADKQASALAEIKEQGNSTLTTVANLNRAAGGLQAQSEIQALNKDTPLNMPVVVPLPSAEPPPITTVQQP